MSASVRAVIAAVTGTGPRVTPGEMDLETLYRTEAKALLTFFVRRTYDAELSVDLVGETFARALEQRHRCRGEVRPWLWGIARILLLETLRKGRTELRALKRVGIEPASLTEEERRRVEDLGELEELRGLVGEALARLAEDQREAVRLRVVDELEYVDVAARLGVSEDAARARVSRGLRAMAAALDGAGA